MRSRRSLASSCFFSCLAILAAFVFTFLFAVLRASRARRRCKYSFDTTFSRVKKGAARRPPTLGGGLLVSYQFIKRTNYVRNCIVCCGGATDNDFRIISFQRINEAIQCCLNLFLCFLRKEAINVWDVAH